MATSNSLTPAPPALSPTVEDGLNLLWRFQLRKENTAIVDKQDAHSNQLQAMIEENERMKNEFDERLAVIEAKLSIFHNDKKRDRFTIEKLAGEMTALKSEMCIVIENQERQLVDSQNTDTETEKPPVLPHPDPLRDYSSGAAARSFNHGTGGPISMDTTNHNIGTPVSATSMDPAFRTVNQNSNEKSTEPTRSPTRSRSYLKHHAPLPPQHIAQATTPKQFKIPRLSQGTGALKSYFTNASKIFATLPKGQKLEIDFIALFIKGIRDVKLRQDLVGELQQKHQSRTKKDGKVEILCKWEDVGVGMMRAGLVQNETGSRSTGGNTGRTSVTGRKKSQIPHMLRELE